MPLEIPGRVPIEAIRLDSPNYIPATVPMQMGNSLRIVIAGGITIRQEMARGFLNAMLQSGVSIQSARHAEANVAIALALTDELLRQTDEQCQTPTPSSPAATDATGIQLP